MDSRLSDSVSPMQRRQLPNFFPKLVLLRLLHFSLWFSVLDGSPKTHTSSLDPTLFPYSPHLIHCQVLLLKDIPELVLLTMPTESSLAKSPPSPLCQQPLCFPSCSTLLHPVPRPWNLLTNKNWTVIPLPPKPSALFPLPIKKIHTLCHISSGSSILCPFCLLSSYLPSSLFSAFQPHSLLYPSERPRSPLAAPSYRAFSLIDT